MRLGSALGAVALLVPASAGAEQPATQPKQWACEGSAKGVDGSAVSMTWFVEANGSVVSRNAGWTPPSVVATAPSAQLRGVVLGPVPDISVSYHQPKKAEIGRPDMVFADVSSDAEPSLIDSPSVSLKLDDGRAWTVALTPFAPQDSQLVLLSGFLADTDVNPDLLLALETAREGEATLSDKSRRPLGQVRYDLSARVERDRLYQKAWAAAELAARHPKLCQETVEGPAPSLPMNDPPPVPVPED